MKAIKRFQRLMRLNSYQTPVAVRVARDMFFDALSPGYSRWKDDD